MGSEQQKDITMRVKHLAMIAIYAIGVATLLLFSFVSEASGFDEPDLLAGALLAVVAETD